MKTMRLVLIAGVAVMMAGCSPKTEGMESSKPAAASTAESQKVTDETAETQPESLSTEAESRAQEGSSDDNFSVDQQAAEAFANQIKEAVSQKDLDTLADLTAYPVYVGFSDGGVAVENREELMALGADKVFSPELTDSVSQADEKNLSPSMAGFVLTRESGGPNIVFGLRNGKLAVTGMNH